MKIKNLDILLIAIVLATSPTTLISQMDDYQYYREILLNESGKEGWTSTPLPDDIYSTIRKDLGDIRIYNISSENDTVEVPYLIDQKIRPSDITNSKYDIINKSYLQGKQMFTIDCQSVSAIDNIYMDISNKNFDYNVRLEGSQNLNNWATIIENYRILAINNGQVNYKYSNLTFPKSKYKYYRITINTEQSVNLNSVKSTQPPTKTAPQLTLRNITSQISNKDKKSKSTVLDIKLKQKMPVSKISISVDQPEEYYRPISISYLRDSVETNSGWKMNYVSIYRGTLSSMERNGIDFPSVVIDQLQVKISNHDNPELSISDVKIMGVNYELTANTNAAGTHFLAYGDKTKTIPNYDLKYFAKKIPESLPINSLGEKKENLIQTDPETKPLFENPMWLWAIMSIMIVVLGWSAFKMLKKQE